jgi:acyl-CoA reductase-like NAD-dependent aldehyde dehydrogenase/isocitrate/isopropylmalate dehydrogenase
MYIMANRLASHRELEGLFETGGVTINERIDPDSSPGAGHYVIGVLRGEGIGPVVVDIALELLETIAESGGPRFQFEFGGSIGIESLKRCGAELNPDVVAFCSSIFSRGGCIFSGPGGGRFVYDLRRRFDLFYKLSPIKSCPDLAGASPLAADMLRGVDIMVVRENVSGVYQGSWRTEHCASTGRVEVHSFSYSERDTRRLLRVASSLAAGRRGWVTVVTKAGGVPGISDLWRSCAVEIASEFDVEPRFLDIDCAAYKLVRDPAEFDVIATPNLFGDVLGDLGGVLVGSRGLTFSGNFAENGAAVFQTNHGSAYDLAGRDLANPAGQILALAFLLREHFRLPREAGLVEDALASVWRMGWRTADVMEPGCRQVGTTQMGRLVRDALAQLATAGDTGRASQNGDVPSRSRVAPGDLTPRQQLRRLPAAIAHGVDVSTDGIAEASIRHSSPTRPEVVLWELAASDRASIGRATAAAQSAHGPWNDAPPQDRAAILLQWATILERDRDGWAVQIAEEIGKPLSQARGELDRSAKMLCAIAARHRAALPRSHGESAVICRRSLGVVALVTPWNNPIYIPLGKIAPALLFGNTVVWKPAPAGSALAVRLLETFARAGGPPGVLNLVCGGPSATLQLANDPLVSAVSLTGSETAGFSVQTICARRSIPFQAELGGNNAAIVWSDTDLARAAELIAEGAFGMAGQRCTANRRAVVHSGCFEEFLELLVPAVSRLGWGDPTLETTQVGPLISVAAACRVARCVEQASAQGFRIVVPHQGRGGEIPHTKVDTFYPPTIILCEHPEAEIVQQETFGPVLVIQPAHDWDHAMRLLNGVRQGLSAALFSRDPERRRQFLSGANAGLLKIDRSTSDAEIDLPFGGWKASGSGPAEHGDCDLEFYTRVQTVYH